MCKGDLPAYRNFQLVGFQADIALVFIKPPQEIAPDCVGSDKSLDRGYTIEIDNVGGIE